MRLPQGPWFPWSHEFRWDRFPWQGTTARERRARQDHRDLAALVEAAATTVGTTARPAGFAFRADASGVKRHDGHREVALLYEADPDELADRFPAMEHARGQPCVDLWICWFPDIGTLDVSGPKLAHLPAGPGGEPIRDGDGLRRALTAYTTEFSTALGPRRA